MNRNRCAEIIVTIIGLLLIGTLVIIWQTGCGESVNPTQPITINVPPSPDTITVREITTPKGAILQWEYSWNITSINDNNGNPIFGKFRLGIFVNLSNIGDREAVDIQHHVSAKSHNGKAAVLEPTDEISLISLSAKATMDNMIYFYNGTIDENIFDKNNKPAGLKIALKYTWKTEPV